MVINTSLFFGVEVVARDFFLFGSKCDLRSASFFFINADRLPKEAVDFVLLAVTPTVCVRLELDTAMISALLFKVDTSNFPFFRLFSTTRTKYKRCFHWTSAKATKHFKPNNI